MNLIDVLLACDNLSIDDIVRVQVVGKVGKELKTRTVDWWIDHIVYGMEFQVENFKLLKDGCSFVVKERNS